MAWMRLALLVVPLVLLGLFQLKQVISSQVSVAGTGSGTSQPFRLEGGAYQVRWSATPTDGADCDVAFALENSDGSPLSKLASGHVDAPGPGTGTLTWSMADPRAYVVRASTTCGAWNVSFTRSGG